MVLGCLINALSIRHILSYLISISGARLFGKGRSQRDTLALVEVSVKEVSREEPYYIPRYSGISSAIWVTQSIAPIASSLDLAT